MELATLAVDKQRRVGLRTRMLQVAPGKERYLRWYEALCRRGQTRAVPVYCERHHIVPRSLGGTDDAANITALTYREHFLAHWLLAKFTEGDSLWKMRHALALMTRNRRGCRRVVAGWQFEVAKRESAAASKGRRKSLEHRAKLSTSLAGRGKSDRHRANMRGSRWSRRGGVSKSESARAVEASIMDSLRPI